MFLRSRRIETRNCRASTKAEDTPIRTDRCTRRYSSSIQARRRKPNFQTTDPSTSTCNRPRQEDVPCHCSGNNRQPRLGHFRTLNGRPQFRRSQRWWLSRRIRSRCLWPQDHLPPPSSRLQDRQRHAPIHGQAIEQTLRLEQRYLRRSLSGVIEAATRQDGMEI